MILSDATIKKLVDEVNMIENFDEKKLQAGSYDLSVGSIQEKYSDTILQPGEFRLISTKEKVNLPKNIGAFCKSKSSFARAGITTGDFGGWIDPGFSGNITLAVFNFGDREFDFKDVDAFAQIIFLPTDTTSNGYNGNYQNSEGVVKSILRGE